MMVMMMDDDDDEGSRMIHKNSFLSQAKVQKKFTVFQSIVITGFVLFLVVPMFSF